MITTIAFLVSFQVQVTQERIKEIETFIYNVEQNDCSFKGARIYESEDPDTRLRIYSEDPMACFKLKWSMINRNKMYDEERINSFLEYMKKQKQKKK